MGVRYDPVTQEHFIDNNQRIINYLRVSITDRCNLRCMYCVGNEHFEFIPHDEIVTYEEIIRLVRLFVKKGIQKVRITGGEPLVRKGSIEFLKELQKEPGLEEVTLTTNGVLLEEYATQLEECGIRRLNISMDTLRPERFFQITGKDLFDQVWRGIHKARDIGLTPLKINVVAIRGFNHDEILDFAKLAIDEPFHVRFIEFMPIGKDTPWTKEQLISIDEIQRVIESDIKLEAIPSGPLDGPAMRFKPRGGAGEIGLIGAITRHFCAACNRLRLTSTGKLRACLLSDDEYDLKSLLRNSQEDSRLSAIIDKAVQNKSRNHKIQVDDKALCGRLMVGIGG